MWRRKARCVDGDSRQWEGIGCAATVLHDQLTIPRCEVRLHCMSVGELAEHWHWHRHEQNTEQPRQSHHYIMYVYDADCTNEAIQPV
jgi:hypothetical protein